MKVLVIAPLPPPITGHSVASQAVVDDLRKHHDVEIVDLSHGSRHDGTVTARRLREVARVLGSVRRARRAADIVYLTIAESLAGNAKDLAIYGLCVRGLERVYLHLHGGTIGRELFERHSLVKRANAAFIRRVGGIIVSGPSHEGIFAGMIAPQRVHVVPNFAADHMFIGTDELRVKLGEQRPLRLLYLSAMTKAKGCWDLADAYCGLPASQRGAVSLDLGGRFETAAEEQAFRARIDGVAGVHYHGLVDEEAKRRLFAAAHVFCLPTAMLEGQPISILEAYASGCAVITTGQRGIRDVFTDGINGFELRERSSAAIQERVLEALRSGERLRAMAATNRKAAEDQYRVATFSERVRRILEAGHASLRR